MPDNRNEVYRDKMTHALGDNDHERYYYLSANLALDDLRERTARGIEPNQTDFDHVAWRFEYAIVAAHDAGKIDDELRATLLLAYIKPMVWADVINAGSLTKSQSERVFDKTGLGASIHSAFEISTVALAQHDELRAIPRTDRTLTQETDLSNIVGFLNETTPHLLFGRHGTSKIFTTPTTAFDDQFSGNVGKNIDNQLYDNRKERENGRYGYQVKTDTSHFHYDPTVPVLYARDFGNNVKSRYWQTSDREFTTLRMLIRERSGELRGSHLSSQLDRIMNDVRKKITTSPERRPFTDDHLPISGPSLVDQDPSSSGELLPK